MVAHAAKLEKLHFSEELPRRLRSLGSKLQYGQGAMISNTSRIENKVTVAENLGLDGRQKITVLGIKFLMKFD